MSSGEPPYYTTIDIIPNAFRSRAPYARTKISQSKREARTAPRADSKRCNRRSHCEKQRATDRHILNFN